jgi:cytoskeletal protein RodZ
VLTRFAAFRSSLYARMEEISYRTAITVVTGVVAVAAVIAGVGLLMTQAPAPGRPTALGSASAARSSAQASAPSTSAAPTSSSPSASPPASTAPARTPAPVKTSPAHEATYPGTAEDAQRAPVARTAAPPVRARRPLGSAVAAWLVWWQRVLASRHGGGTSIGHGGLGAHWGHR